MARKRVSPAKREKNLRIGEKIQILRHEGLSQREAQGKAFGMERTGRLGRHGAYRHVGRGKRRRSGR